MEGRKKRRGRQDGRNKLRKKERCQRWKVHVKEEEREGRLTEGKR